MRTIEVSVFTFPELSNEAKQRALDHYNRGFEYPWYDEVGQCRDGLLECFPGAYLDRDNDARTGQIDDTLLEMKGKRLCAWLQNNVLGKLQKGKYRHMQTYNETPHKRVRREESKVTGNKWRYYRSDLTFTVECPFSGMVVDCSALDPIIKFVTGTGFPRTGRQWNETTLEDIIQECFHAINQFVDQDIEYLTSMEAFEETCEANEYEFTESGELI